jgi:hypothetical protein
MCATPTACPQALATARSRATPMRSAPRGAAGTLECDMRTLVLRTLPLEHGQDPLGTGDRPQEQLTPVGFTRVSGERLLTCLAFQSVMNQSKRWQRPGQVG